MTFPACASCRFYEPSGHWRSGWCRNPKLYGPQESHPVQSGTLDCANAASRSAWEPVLEAANVATTQQRQSIELRETKLPELSVGTSTSRGEPMSVGTGGGESNEERTVSYQPEERYWTDYLRIALPVIGLLLLIGLLWYWASALIGDGGNQPPPTAETVAVITPVHEATPEPPTATAVIIAPTPGPPPIPTATAAPAVATTQTVTPTPAALAANSANPC